MFDPDLDPYDLLIQHQEQIHRLMHASTLIMQRLEQQQKKIDELEAVVAVQALDIIRQAHDK